MTEIDLEEGAVFTLDTAQIRGVDSTVRKTRVRMKENSRLYVTERLMTHDAQTAVSDIDVEMNGAGTNAQIISRSVAKGDVKTELPSESDRKCSLPCAYPV